MAADLEKIQQLLADGEKLAAARKQVGKLQTAINDLVAAIGGGTTPASKPKKEKEDHPKEGSAPDKLCKHMSATTPITAAELAKKVGSSEATIKLYLNKFTAFSNVRGKGYVYQKLTTTTPTSKKKTTKKKSKKKT